MLGGGGNLGAVQVGQLQALVERGIEPEVILGCSVGAINGAAFAAQPTQAGIDALRQHWLGLSAQPSGVMPAGRIPNAVQLVLKGSALFDNVDLRTNVSRFVDHTSTFDQLVTRFECVATDIDGSTERWFSDGPLIDALLASAALPSVYPIVEIEGRRYFDGGVVNNVPLSRAYEMHAKTVFVMHTGLHSTNSRELKRPVDAALLAFWVGRNARFTRDLQTKPESTEVVVLPVGPRPDLRFDDFSQTEALMATGYERAHSYLDTLDREPDAFARAERLAKDVRRSVEEWRSGRKSAEQGPHI